MTFSVRLILAIILLAASICNARASGTSLMEMRKVFLQAEQYINQNRDTDYFALAETLKNYPLYPYLHYQWLKNHLDDDTAVLTFLRDYAQSRYALLLHQKWLIQLGKKQQWSTFINHYRNSEDAELQCYSAQALYYSGQQQAAYDGARRLWLSGKTQPAACDDTFALLKSSSYYSSDLVWQRFQAALNLDNDSLAGQLIPLLSDHDRQAAELWLKLHRQPKLIKEPSAWKRQDPQAGLLFAHTIGRWSDSDPSEALAVWDNEKQHFQIPTDTAAEIEKKLALALAFKHDHRAYDRLLQLSGGSDSTVREWRVRAALSQQHWQNVATALAALSDEEKRQDKWQYWLARSLNATGQTGQAEAIFRQLANNRSFYGFLAADRMRLPQILTNRPVVVSDQEIETLQAQNEFQIVSEFLAIDRKPEAKRQWWYATSGMDTHGLAVAAKLAQRWQWPSIAIFTIAKANDWDDMELRFPIQFTTPIQESATARQLDPTLIFGLIRQESGFDEAAESPAGAKGLMQVMPKTGQLIAADLKETWAGDNNLFNPELNIKYGSYYYKKLLRQFDNHHLLAIAAYNAGPNRVKRWLPEKKDLPGDIWVESIPYKETRGYVSSVLLYAFIYQQRLQRNSLKPGELMRDVMPG